MFFDLEPLPGDPILALMSAYRSDTSPNKVDLGVGVYQDDNGDTPVMAAVSAAEQWLLDHQKTKAYVGIAGAEPFNQAMANLAFGDTHPALVDGRIVTVQSAGGSGGLRVAAELINSLRPGSTVWATSPTWPNHQPLLSSAGLTIKEFRYYDPASGGVDEAGMMADIAAIPDGDVLLLHGCCHNPTGADLSLAQWQRIAELCEKKHLLPFVDTAYQGFGDGLESDVAGLRLLAAAVPEMIAVTSCSKNFGLYRERIGSLSVVTTNAENAAATRTHLMKIVRAMISMPPDHGASIVATILNDAPLRAQWQTELQAMCKRMARQRQGLVGALEKYDLHTRFGPIAEQRGMFSLLGITRDEIASLREKWHVYLVGSSRVNVAGLIPAKLDYIAEALADTLRN